MKLRIIKGLTYVVLTVGSTPSALSFPHCPPIIGHISRALVRINLETGGVNRIDTADLAGIFACPEPQADKLLDEYQRAWWLQLGSGTPPRLTLIDCMNAFKHDEWQLAGQPKPIQPPPPIRREDARRFLTTWQGWIADFIDKHLVGMDGVCKKLIEDGFPPPEDSPRALLETYRHSARINERLLDDV